MPSYFRAIKRLCHLSRVSGVTIGTILRRVLTPACFALAASWDALTIGKARLPSELFPKDFDLLQQVIYQELLVSINLAG